MLADQLDYIVGVDPHRDSHALAVVEVVSGVVVFESTVIANNDGYGRALELAERYAPGRRAFAIEGTGSFGAGLTRFLTCGGERVLEVGRLRRERRSGGKTDALDAVRAARSVLTQERPSTPRAGGERQALQALVAAREGAVNAKRAGLCQLRDLLITTPEPLRSELRPLTRARLLQRLATTRPAGRRDPELRGSLLALRSIARRVLQLTAEERELDSQQPRVRSSRVWHPESEWEATLVHSEALEQANFDDIDAALAWAKKRADAVIVRLGASEETHYSAGRRVFTKYSDGSGVAYPIWPPDTWPDYRGPAHEGHGFAS